ncbi:MAG: DUF3021 domain-containing protein [Oscillospiraceae bacterium]|jgi:hypothetical protein
MNYHIGTRALVGAMAGVFIGQIVTLCISAGIGDGDFVAVMPQLVSRCTNEWTAALVQTVLMALLGIVFAEASILFFYERWSFFKQCILHFLITAIFYVPFVLFCWMPATLCNALFMLGTLLFNYALIWFIQYRINCRDVRAINQIIDRTRSEQEGRTSR